MLRYQENDELHRDFHGTTNMTLEYIANQHGEEALKSILRKTGHDVYKSIREKLAKGDASELIEHLNWFYHREGAPFRLEVSDSEIRIEVLECPAVKHLKKLGLPVSKHCCLQTSEVNAGMCEGTPWKTNTVVLEQGHCIQIFRKGESK